SSELPLTLLELGGLAQLPAPVADPSADPAHHLPQRHAGIAEPFMSLGGVAEEGIGGLLADDDRLGTHLLAEPLRDAAARHRLQSQTDRPTQRIICRGGTLR